MIRISPDFYTEFQNFRIFLRILQFFEFFQHFLSYLVIITGFDTANSDKKYMKLNGVALNLNKPCVTSQKTAFLKDKVEVENEK